MTALNDILDWSLGAPAWLRDALRRIVTTSTSSDVEVAELVELCKTPHGLSAKAQTPVFLETSHIPVAPVTGAVCISAVTHVSDVNALAPNETLSFAPTGLTIIYGDNGAGKSGFTRILRRACRARGGDAPILANALSDKPAGAPTARIDYTLAGTPHSHTWKDGTPADGELSAVSVFDTTAAQVYIEDKTEVRFRPFGLDVTDRAAAICLRVKKALEAEVDELRMRSYKLPSLPATTSAGRLISGLTALTPHAEVDRLGTLSAEDDKELTELADILAAARVEDPKKRGADLKLKAGRQRRLLAELRDLNSTLADAEISQLIELTSAANIADEEACRFASEFAKELSLSGVGSAEWSTMWNAAKTYSENQAYREHPFPNSGEGAQCVLCQQELGTSGKVRMQRFAEFALGSVQATARQKRDDADRAKRKISDLRPGEATADALSELSEIDAAVASQVGSFLASAKDCHSDVLASVTEPRRCCSPPVAELEALIADLERQANSFTQAADPATRAKSEQRVAELDARRTLGVSATEVHGEIDRRARLNAYDRCLKDTETRSITKLGVDLTKKYVTDALTAAFASELSTLGFKALELELKPASGQRGQLFHKVQLKHATRAELPKVVSEGESRCIALAAFIAELHGAAHASAIVFDDPVSSLDHSWRTSVARRLVEAASTRQVIVFTHEFVFLATLLQEAEMTGVPAVTHTVRRQRGSAGHVAPGLPWHGLSTRRRIGLLRERWVKAEKVHRTSGQDEYEPIATSIYADLRRTWERAIEEILLNQVVLRFRPGIETNRLRKLGDISQDDLDAVENGMTKSSKWEGGHDQALAVNERLPPPAELRQDIDALDAWVASVEKRRK